MSLTIKQIIRRVIKIILLKTGVGKLFLTITKWQSSKFLPLRWLGLIMVMPIYRMIGDRYYSLIIALQNHYRKVGLPRTSPIPTFYTKVLLGDKSATAEKYAEILKETKLDPEIQYTWIHRFWENGRLDLACLGFHDLISRTKNNLTPERQLVVFREMGALYFMMGNNSEANHYWRLAGQFRRILSKPDTPKGYRILGSAWFVAIGHIAMLDYFLKYLKLYHKENLRVVVQLDFETIPNPDMLLKFINLGVVLLAPNKLEKDYNKWAKKNNEPLWKFLSASEKAALIDDFWEFDFPDGEILGYAHAASRIQKEWEKRSLPPLFKVTENEKRWLASYLNSLGIPQNAWFVCLHVREGGFHQQWNSIYPTLRDAAVEDYFGAIEQIVKAGGWVIRMGDSSMKPLPPMRNVVDYAHSHFKTSCGDIILAASCRFFLGTNSGFATVSVIYNVPCALTNWVPIGWPLWPTQDLMIPKLFRDKNTGLFLTLEQIFERGLAFIQSLGDLPAEIELVPNSADDITRLAIEMLTRCKLINSSEPVQTGVTTPVQIHYSRIAKHYETYTGSQIARSFIEKYPDVFSYPETEFTNYLQAKESNKLRNPNGTHSRTTV